MRDHHKVLQGIERLATASERSAFDPDYEGQTRKQEVVLNLIEEDLLPDHITCWDAFENPNLGNDKPYHEYWFSVTVGELVRVLFLDEEGIREHLNELKDQEMPNLPSDGSKGQWKVAQKNKIKAVEWLLEEGDSDEG